MVEKRARGRPRKYASENKSNEQETSQFETFFNLSERKQDNVNYNISDIVKLVFDDIFVKYSAKCYNQLMHYTDHPILNKLFNEVSIDDSKAKNEKTCDDVFYEYLSYCKSLANKNYFIIVLKFILLFRECLNISRSNMVEQNVKVDQPFLKKEYSSYFNADSIPELCNEFVTEYLEKNEYFGINSEKDKNEVIELIQHFCYWLYKMQYTASRLSRIS
jgi:hypothetical protein